MQQMVVAYNSIPKEYANLSIENQNIFKNMIKTNIQKDTKK